MLNFRQENEEVIEPDLKQNYKKKQIKKTLERLTKFISWFDDENIETIEVNLEDEENETNLDKNQTLRRQAINIKRITQDLKDKEMHMRLKVESELENNEKIDVKNNKEEEEEDVDIDDI